MDTHATCAQIETLCRAYSGECYPDTCEAIHGEILRLVGALRALASAGGLAVDWDDYPRAREVFTDM